MAGQGSLCSVSSIVRGQAVLQAWHCGKCIFTWGRHRTDRLCEAWVMLLLSCGVTSSQLVASSCPGA